MWAINLYYVHRVLSDVLSDWWYEVKLDAEYVAPSMEWPIVPVTMTWLKATMAGLKATMAGLTTIATEVLTLWWPITRTFGEVNPENGLTLGLAY